MTDLSLFQFEGSSVRVVEKDGNPWWVVGDVCAVLGIKDPSMAAARLDEDEKGTISISTAGGDQDVLGISESGLYQLVFTSRKPIAKRFKRWLAHDVLPLLRKAELIDKLLVRSFVETLMDSVVHKAHGYVYALADPKNHRVKIGFTSFPDRRLKSLQCGDSLTTSFIALQEFGSEKEGRMAEKLMHRYYKNDCISGEWFSSAICQTSFFEDFFYSGDLISSLDARGLAELSVLIVEAEYESSATQSARNAIEGFLSEIDLENEAA